ncbi:hypothetical protein C8Q79DRAFT_1005531 [Trametes meyenii]|nr:hypothetical protein C8Q79DRAFT_1005531 [Trametes meyenii]
MLARDVRVTVTLRGGDEERVSSSQLLLVPPSVDAVRPPFFAASNGLYTHPVTLLEDLKFAKTYLSLSIVRGGAIAWGVVMFLYSLAGGIFLLNWGQFIFFVNPEWQIYGGIGIGVAVAAALSILALSNVSAPQFVPPLSRALRSYIWTRVCKFIWPFVIVVCAVRAIIMIVELQRGKDKIQWECAHGGVLWTESAEAGYGGSSSFPAGFCTSGFSSLYAAFIGGLAVDLVFQMYMFFLVWRFQKRLEHYQGMKGPFYGGYYNA